MRITSSLMAIGLTLAVAAPAQAQYLQVPQGAMVDNSLDATMQPRSNTQPMPMQQAPMRQPMQDSQATAQATQRYETVTGGVTGEERAGLDASQRGKSVKLVFAATNGEYFGDVMVAIKDAKGEEVSNFKADGPFAFIALPTGNYTVTAMVGSQTRTQKIVAGKVQKTYTIRFAPQ